MPILHWLNDEEARKTSSRVSYRLLEADDAHSYGDPNVENMLIQGDNLEALKALLPYYAGQVKCIFIDPPYNTQSAFEHYDDNLEHSIWLSTMYPRMEMLRDLLANDGSIWVSIDDNEGHYLKVMMDEVFGRNNFVANVVWQKKYTVANDSKWLSENHDHVFVYASNKEFWRPYSLGRSAEMDARYRNPDDHPKGPWKATPLYAKRSGSEKEKKFRFRFKNGVEWSSPLGTSPRFPEETLRQMDENNEIWFGVDGKAIPSRKTFLSELKILAPPTPTVWLHTDVGNNHEAREQSKVFNPNDPFRTPKPERLLKRILDLATNPGDLILDSFLGSGTTAAVAHKMGRRYIGIEMGDHAVTHCAPRLKKVVNGEQGGISNEVNWQGGGGFHFYKLGEAIFDEEGKVNPAVRFRALAAHVWFTETHIPLRTKGKKASPLLGVHNGIAYYLLYNGILGDQSKDGGNVLTGKILASLPPHHGQKVIYGELTTFSSQRLARENILFKQVPYDIKAR
jgi:adenine-specific DNA-methyltransferase